jgi:predicted RNase H-like nuclease
MIFIGLDLAWSVKHNTAGAVIEYDAAEGNENGRLVTWRETLGDNTAILEFVNEVAPAPAPAIMAVDAPLAVPNVNGSRPCDRALTQVFGKYQAGTHPANRTNLGRYGQPPGDIRGETLAQLLVDEIGFEHSPYLTPRQQTRQFFECYPHPAMVALFRLDKTLKYKRKLKSLENDRHMAYQELQRLLGSLSSPEALPRLEIPPELLSRNTRQLAGAALKHYEDLLDAIMCSYIAFYHWWWGEEISGIFGNIEEGHIVTPITPELRALMPRLSATD